MSIQFERLAPPVGGLSRLQQRLDQEECTTNHLEFWESGAAFAVCLAAAFVLLFSIRQPAGAELEKRLIAADTIAANRLNPVVVSNNSTSAVLPVSQSNEVVFYWVVGTSE